MAPKSHAPSADAYSPYSTTAISQQEAYSSSYQTTSHPSTRIFSLPTYLKDEYEDEGSTSTTSDPDAHQEETVSRRVVSMSQAAKASIFPLMVSTTQTKLPVLVQSTLEAGRATAARDSNNASEFSMLHSPTPIRATIDSESFDRLYLHLRTPSPSDRSDTSSLESVIIIDGSPTEIPPESFRNSRPRTPQVRQVQTQPQVVLPSGPQHLGHNSYDPRHYHGLPTPSPHEAFLPIPLPTPEQGPHLHSYPFLSIPQPYREVVPGWHGGPPPRPIPALHGPLSLPYARCPSGAEGEIFYDPMSIQDLVWDKDKSIDGHPPPLLHPDYEAVVDYSRENTDQEQNDVVILVDADLTPEYRRARPKRTASKVPPTGYSSDAPKNNSAAKKVEPHGTFSEHRALQDPSACLTDQMSGLSIQTSKDGGYPQKHHIAADPALQWSPGTDVQLSYKVQAHLQLLIEEQKHLLNLEKEDIHRQMEQERRREYRGRLLDGARAMSSTLATYLSSPPEMRFGSTWLPGDSPQPAYECPEVVQERMMPSLWPSSWSPPQGAAQPSSPEMVASRWVAELTGEGNRATDPWVQYQEPSNVRGMSATHAYSPRNRGDRVHSTPMAFPGWATDSWNKPVSTIPSENALQLLHEPPRVSMTGFYYPDADGLKLATSNTQPYLAAHNIPSVHPSAIPTHTSTDSIGAGPSSRRSSQTYDNNLSNPRSVPLAKLVNRRGQDQPDRRNSKSSATPSYSQVLQKPKPAVVEATPRIEDGWGWGSPSAPVEASTSASPIHFPNDIYYPIANPATVSHQEQMLSATPMRYRRPTQQAAGVPSAWRQPLPTPESGNADSVGEKGKKWRKKAVKAPVPMNALSFQKTKDETYIVDDASPGNRSQEKENVPRPRASKAKRGHKRGAKAHKGNAGGEQ